MSEAVFISYASQDADAAKRICESLRAEAIEVWLDQDELLGGDAWESRIRQQIRDCALFMPVISAHTQERPEGFFRLEWHLAEQRTYSMAHDQPFLIPVIVDDTADAAARVPERFRERQWTRLPGGRTPRAFCERVKALMNGPSAEPGRPATVPALRPRSTRPWIIPAVASLAVLTTLISWIILGKRDNVVAIAPQGPVAAPLSEARDLVQRANAILGRPGEKDSEMLGAAEEFYSKALELDPSDADTWAGAARLDAQTVFLHQDVSEARRERAKQRADRAIALAPDSPAARRAQACVFAFADGSPAMLSEAERIYRELLPAAKDDKAFVSEYGLVLRQEHKFAEAGSLIEKFGSAEDAGWIYCRAGKYDDANRIADQLLAKHHTLGAVLLKLDVVYFGFEDFSATQAAISLFTPEELMKDAPAMNAAHGALWGHDYDKAIAILRAFPQEFLFTFGFGGPKRYMIGLAHEKAGRPEAAQAEWRVSLQQVQDRLKAKPDDPEMLGMEALLQACLGEREEAERNLVLYRSLAGPRPASAPDEMELFILLRLGRKDEVLSKVAAFLNARPQGYEFLHSDLRFDVDYDSLRGDPRFDRLLRDSLPPFAKPFDVVAAK